jgi:hypothetical protein
VAADNGSGGATSSGGDTVTLTEQDFQALQQGATVQEASSVTAEHQHLITVVCA